MRPESAALCAKLLECLALRMAGARAPLAGAETRAFTTYQHCRSHIELHSLRLRTLAQIASECHVNNAYLCRLFRRYDKQSPYQYLLRLKMHHAAGRLKEPGALVKQVAEESGFADPFHFSRVFASVSAFPRRIFAGCDRARLGKWWLEPELNRRHKDFQSSALPTELSSHDLEHLTPAAGGWQADSGRLIQGGRI